MNTTSLCGICYAVIPAVTEPFAEDSVPMIYKNCPAHGLQRAKLEADREFYEANNTYDRRNHYPILIINVTDRCNIKCPHCFYPPGSGSEMSLEDFKSCVAHFRPNFSGFIISGGDPTCWEHYFEAAEWCRSEGILLSQLTNGVKLADPEFYDRVVPLFTQGEFLLAEMSIHPNGYNTAEVKDKQIEVLERLRADGLKLTCCMINIDPKQCSSVETDNIMSEVMEFMQEWRDVIGTYRLRPVCKAVPTLHLSHLIKSLQRGCEHNKWVMVHSRNKDIDNIYNQNFIVDGMDVVTVRAPTVENIDLGYLGRGPFMLANDGMPYSVPHALIINEGISKGWYNGQRLTGS